MNPEIVTHSLPRLHRVHGEFSLMDSDRKELFPVSHSALDELCRRSNSHAALVAALKVAEVAMSVAYKQTHFAYLEGDLETVRAALQAASPTQPTKE